MVVLKWGICPYPYRGRAQSNMIKGNFRFIRFTIVRTRELCANEKVEGIIVRNKTCDVKNARTTSRYEVCAGKVVEKTWCITVHTFSTSWSCPQFLYPGTRFFFKSWIVGGETIFRGASRKSEITKFETNLWNRIESWLTIVGFRGRASFRSFRFFELPT